LLALALVAQPMACVQTFLFDGAAPPRIEGSALLLEERPGAPPSRWPVRTIEIHRGVGYGPLAALELEALRRGEPLAEGTILRVEVATDGVVWRDHALRGFGIGVVAGFLVAVGIGVEPDGSGGLTLPISLIVAAAVGLNGMLYGGLVGMTTESGTVDMRLRGRPP